MDFGALHWSAEVAEALQEDALRLWGLAERGAAFDKYAAACIFRWKSLGKDTKPMEVFLAAPRSDLRASI